MFEILREAERRLGAAGVEAAAFDARLLLRAATGWSAAEVVSENHRPLPDEARALFEGLVRERAARRPLQHLTGRVEFYGLPLAVGPGALIPRPDTETLVEAVLDFVRERQRAAAGGKTPPGAGSQVAPLPIADVGCGAGPVALALAAAVTAQPRPEAGERAPDESARPVRATIPVFVVGFEIAPAALALADENRREIGLRDRVALVRGDLLTAAHPGSFAVVAANLPYVPRAEIERLEPEVRDHEPRDALDGGEDGLDPLRRLLPLAARALAPEGALFVEIGAGQRAEASRTLAATGWRHFRTIHDLAGVPRVLAAAPPRPAVVVPTTGSRSAVNPQTQRARSSAPR